VPARMQPSRPGVSRSPSTTMMGMSADSRGERPLLASLSVGRLRHPEAGASMLVGQF
jgi:hypothetical protein